jgi:hypothetical protein
MQNAKTVLDVLIVTGEPAAGKLARRVRRETVRKRTRTGTSSHGRPYQNGEI